MRNKRRRKQKKVPNEIFQALSVNRAMKNKHCLRRKKMIEQVLNHWLRKLETKYTKRFELGVMEGMKAEGKHIGCERMKGENGPTEWNRVKKECSKWLSRRRTGERWIEEINKKRRNTAWDRWQFKNDVLEDSLRKAILAGASLEKDIVEKYQREQMK